MQKRDMTIISFVVSIVLWTLLLGSIQMAVGFLALIFVHEMGHYLAAKHKGVLVSPPVFTPMGAFISLLELPKSAADEAFMAFAGPLLGTIAGVLTLVAGIVFNIPMLAQLAFYAFILNLFNLIPLAPLDGGRISMGIERRMWVIGAAIVAYLIYLSVMSRSYFTLFIAAYVVMQAIPDIKQRGLLAEQYPSYFDVGITTRIGYTLAYLALGAFLVYATLNLPDLVAQLIKLGL